MSLTTTDADVDAFADAFFQLVSQHLRLVNPFEHLDVRYHRLRLRAQKWANTPPVPHPLRHSFATHRLAV